LCEYIFIVRFKVDLATLQLINQQLSRLPSCMVT